MARRLEFDSIIARDFTFGFGDMTPYMRKLDLFFINLECQIAKTGSKMDKNERSPYHYRGKPEMIKALVETGVDVVTVANNHGMDYGPDALLETLEHCRKNGIVAVGGGANAREAAAPGFVRVNDLTVGFVGFNSVPPYMNAGSDLPGLNSVRHVESDHFLAAAKVCLQKARTKADVVVFTVHWGPNYRKKPTDKEREIAHGLLDMGYDVVIGHSAHQFLAVEVYKGKAIIHDAGNFAVDFKPVNRGWNDRNLMFVLYFKGNQLEKVEAIPIYRKASQTNFAKGEIAKSICERFVGMTEALGTNAVATDDHRVVVPVAPHLIKE